MIVEKLLKADYDVSTTKGSESFCRDNYKRDDCATLSIIGKQCSILLLACIEYKNMFVTTSLEPHQVASSYVDSSCVASPVLEVKKKKGGKRIALMLGLETPGSVVSDTLRTEEITPPFFKLAEDGLYGNAIIAAFVCAHYEGEIAMNTVQIRLLSPFFTVMTNSYCAGLITMNSVQCRILARFVTHMTIGALTNATYLQGTRR